MAASIDQAGRKVNLDAADGVSGRDTFLREIIILILTGLLRGVRTHHALVLENLALRHQLAVLRRTAARPRLRPCDRLF
jgi:hypothetical protein